jgi:hypothetical protein
MEDLTLIKFKVTNKLFGYPQPFIPDGSIVILIQEGRIEFSLYNEATQDFPNPTFNHPKEQEKNRELELEVEELIKQKHPQYLTSDVSIVLTCPTRIAEKIIW